MASKSSPSKLGVPHPNPEEPTPTHQGPTMATSVATSDPDIKSAFKLIHAHVRSKYGISEAMQMLKSMDLRGVLVATLCYVLWTLVYGLPEYDLKKDQGGGWKVQTGNVISIIMIAAPHFIPGFYGSKSDKEEWEVLKDPTGEDRIVLVTKLGNEIVGALVICPFSSDNPKDLVPVLVEDEDKKAVSQIAAGQKVGLIKASAVDHQYRGKGIGNGLLREAAEICQGKGWAGPVFDGEDVDSSVLEKVIREEQGWA